MGHPPSCPQRPGEVQVKMSRSMTVGLLFCLLWGAGLLWMALAGPMLLHFKFGPLPSDRRLVVWNPFRNKEPERFGAEYLAAIQSQQCRETMAKLDVSSQEKGQACDKQERRPLVGSCPMVDRRDAGDFVWLLFHCSEQAHQDVLAEVGLSLRKRGNVWVLEGYERIN
jgi:hypothetical protein